MVTSIILVAATGLQFLAANCWNSEGLLNALIRVAMTLGGTGTAILAAPHLGLSL